MSTGEHKPPDNQSTRPSARMTNGQAIASSVIDSNLEVRAISVLGEESSDQDGLDTSFITLDFGHNPPQKVVGAELDMSFTGLETDTPFVQVGELFFKGRWAEIIGTEMVVGQDGDEGIKVIGTTRRRLVLERVNLKRIA